MENENIQENIPETTPDAVEIETDIPVSETDMVPAPETTETTSDVLPDENISDSPILEEEIPETNLDPNLDPETSMEIGETENETTEILDNGNETNTGSLSDNDIGDGSTPSDMDKLPYTINYYAETTETIPLWENNISNFSTSEMLLFMIFLLLLVQFIHNIFKGSHWLKG